MTDKPSVIRETDDEARGLARRLLRSARYVALAVVRIDCAESGTLHLFSPDGPTLRLEPLPYGFSGTD